MLSQTGKFLSRLARRLRIRRSIHVTMLGPRADIALVHIRHGLLSRMMFSEPETDILVCFVPALGGGRLWLVDSPQRPVTDRGVIEALEREWNGFDGWRRRMSVFAATVDDVLKTNDRA